MTTRPFIGAIWAVLVCGIASAQHSSTVKINGGHVQVITNGNITIVTSVVTNGGGIAIGSTSSGGFHSLGGTGSGTMPMDPQAILKAFRHGGMATLANPNAASHTDTNPVTWLGVSADEVSDDMRAQLPIPDNAGLIVRDVTKDSPAEISGLQPNDILIKLDDQLLVNAPQLQSLIRGKKSGDEIAVTLLRKGRETKIKSKLASKVPSVDDSDSMQVINLGNFDLDMNKLFGQLNASGGPVVFQKSFSTAITNGAAGIDPDDLQATINEAVKKAMEKMQKQMNAKKPGK